MKDIELELVNRLGLHARAASKLVQTASSFDSQVWLSHRGKRVNAKSIMGVLLLAAPCGSRLTLEVDGSDEDAAAEAIAGLVADRFGEGE
ncbi:HPr family phosphocarrier protein [Wenzhouxiangella sp. EGI_FJ10305]|uniref:HPr family phosphocarrier protein n=1 Tax=Wenzhouxiangella sp. EGI_FJ10305 TaxID=3243768 RepID=UPI0035E19D84